jgi:hypothetical protein
MSLSISLNYTTNLPSLLANKLVLGYARNGYRLEGPYEADQGWDNLFTDYLAKRAEPHRAGATTVDIGARGGGKTTLPGASKVAFFDVPPPVAVEE